VARKDSGVFYYFSDHLKTAAVETVANGNIQDESDFYPWGGELQFTSSNDNHYKFTGKERDAESGLDYFGARYYGNALGRFMTPDWAANATAIPYADFGNPQSLNLYNYVGDNPLAHYDTDGHCWPISACAEAAMAQINKIQQKIETKAIASGHPAFAATATFASGVTRDVINGVVGLGTVGKATGAVIDSGSATQKAVAISQDLGKAVGIALIGTGLAGAAAGGAGAEASVGSQSVGPSAGESVFRVWGGDASPGGRSWTDRP
jgi:RHS repeat-associated protein